MTRHTSALLMFAMAISLASCGKQVAPTAKAPVVDSDFAAGETAWRMERHERLVRPDGWTSLIGLHWIDPKAHFVGSNADNGIRLAMGPPKLGMVEEKGGHVFFVPEKGVPTTLDGQPVSARVELRDDQTDAPSKLGFDDDKGLITVISRGGREALRVKHADAETRVGFAGLDYWPADPSWKVAAKFVPNAPGKTIPIVDIIGNTTEMPNPGALEFQRDGKTWRIEALDEGGDGLSLIFADRTNGHGSYGAGRFLDTDKPDANGKVMVDFNRAYNPPCAFTPFATCPLPPPENRIALAVTAGEKKYAKSAH